MNFFGMFENPAYKGLLTDQESEQLGRQSLLNAGLAILAGSQGGQPGTGRAALFPALQQGLQAGQQAYQGGVGDILKARDIKRQQDTMQQRKAILSGLSGAPEQALAEGGGPTIANAEKMQMDMSGRLKQAYAAALSMGDLELAKTLAEQIKQTTPVDVFDKIDPSKFTPESIKKFAASRDYGDLMPNKEGAKFSGAYGNLALAMFGTNDSSQMSPQQLQALDIEARKRQLERPASVSVNVGGGENAFTKKGAELMAGSFNDLANQGKMAQRSLNQINELDNLLSKTGGGFGAQAKMIAGNFGIPVEGLNDVQAAMAIINQLVPAQRPQGSGGMSDRDVELFKQSVPRLINQPEGNKKIIQTMRGIAEYDRKMGQIASDALTGRISREEADTRMQNLPSPLKQSEPTAPKKFDRLPDPAQYNGRVIVSDAGIRYKSNGKTWVREGQ